MTTLLPIHPYTYGLSRLPASEASILLARSSLGSPSPRRDRAGAARLLSTGPCGWWCCGAWLLTVLTTTPPPQHLAPTGREPGGQAGIQSTAPRRPPATPASPQPARPGPRVQPQTRFSGMLLRLPPRPLPSAGCFCLFFLPSAYPFPLLCPGPAARVGVARSGIAPRPDAVTWPGPDPCDLLLRDSTVALHPYC